MADAPKLYTHKPKKAQLKQSGQRQQSMASSTPQGTTGSAPPPPPQPPKESFMRRYKFVWPLLLAVNFTVGAYLFTRTKKKDVSEEAGEVPNVPSAGVPTTAATARDGVPTIAATAKDTEKPLTPSAIDTGKPLSAPPILEPPKPREPIPENQQRELFKWILEEKRKLKPKDPEEKKRIDEEKALLKHFIRSKSVPSL